MIYDIDADGNTKLISRLSGPDTGPKSQYVYSNWEKKVISGLSNKMMIEFKSDDIQEDTGFSLNILFAPLQNEICQSNPFLLLSMKKSQDNQDSSVNIKYVKLF